jgi:hypothetical protein
MNPAKLRRSRDVSERYPIKIEIAFQIRELDAQARALAVGGERDEYVHQVADLIAKSQLTGRFHCSQSPYVFSGEHRTVSPDRGISTL